MQAFDTTTWHRDLHRFRHGGLNILLDVNSGAIHTIDDLTWDVLEALEATGGNVYEIMDRLAHYSPVEVEEVLSELSRLESEGSLFTSDQELVGYRGSGESYLKSLCLHVAHDCNLRCRYCFAGTGPFGGDRSLMPVEVGRAAIDLLIKESGPRGHCEVDFFGGEPLLNFPVVQELVAYGRDQGARHGKEIRFTLTTNGVLLDDEVTRFLNREGVRAVLSLDGRPEVHDAMRPFRGGQPSYREIVPRFQRFVASRHGRDYYIRGTYTAYNTDFSRDVLHVVSLGFDQVSVEPVVAPAREPYALDHVNLDALEREYELLAEACLASEEAGQPINYFHFNLELQKGPCLPRRLAGCGAGHEYLAVTPSGELYPCHQFVGRREFLLGDVFRGLTEKDLSNRFLEAHVYNKEMCRDCWARFFCSGGCHANNFAHGGDLFRPYELGCALQRKRLECGIYLQVRRMLHV